MLAEEGANITYNKCVNLFTNLFNTNCPVNISNITQGKRKNKRPDKPWMTTCLKNACKKKKHGIQTIPKKTEQLKEKLSIRNTKTNYLQFRDSLKNSITQIFWN